MRMRTHTYVRTYIQTYRHTYIHTYIRAYIQTYIHTHMHTYIHTYITISPASTSFYHSPQFSTIPLPPFSTILYHSPPFSIILHNSPPFSTSTMLHHSPPPPFSTILKSYHPVSFAAALLPPSQSLQLADATPTTQPDFAVPASSGQVRNRICNNSSRKGLRDRNSPTCTLSQNGYGAMYVRGQSPLHSCAASVVGLVCRRCICCASLPSSVGRGGSQREPSGS